MRHLRRILVIGAGAIAVAYSTAIATPAVTNLIAHHPIAAGYVDAAVAVIGAVYVYVLEGRAGEAAAPPSTGTSMGTK